MRTTKIGPDLRLRQGYVQNFLRSLVLYVTLWSLSFQEKLKQIYEQVIYIPDSLNFEVSVKLEPAQEYIQ